MCGIVGYLREPASDVFPLHAMAAALYHRGPDSYGAWEDPTVAVGLGHRRLAIIDLSPGGHQPRRSASGRYIVTFNGEIYNFKDLRKRLALTGRSFSSNSDTEVLVEAVDEWGVVEALRAAVGMFALAIWDVRERILSLAIDRLGEKPLYYARVSNSLLFASELKALEVCPDFQPSVAPSGVDEVLNRGYISAPRTIYSEVFKVCPGQILSFTARDGRASSARVEEYWSLEMAYEIGARSPFSGSPGEAVESLDELLYQTVKLQMIADVPLGAFLSGGVDSTTIVALMRRATSGTLKTFSIGFEEGDFNEADYAREAANHLGTQHHELIVGGSDAISLVPRLAEIYDEPIADSSQIPTYLVARLASQHVKVSLSGDAGDELFLGYKTYQYVVSLWRYTQRIPVRVRTPLSKILLWLSAKGSSLPRGIDRNRIRKMAMSLKARSPDDIHEVLTQLQGACSSKCADLRVSMPYETPEAHSLTRLGVRDLMTYVPGDILVKVDRAAMANSLETRVPMLDHRVVEFALRLPDALKMRSGEQKWVIRQVLAQYVPASFLDRPKRGFSIPLAFWLRTSLREWAEDVITSSVSPDGIMWGRGDVLNHWKDHLDGRTDNHHYLWGVLMLETWYRHSKKRRLQ